MTDGTESPPNDTPSGTGDRRPKKKHRLAKLGLVLGSVVFTLLLTELAARIWKGEYRLANFHTEHLDMFRRALPTEYHPRLGWIPAQGYSDGDNVWGTQVTIRRDGIRANSPDGAVSVKNDSGELVVAVGDSFAFGDEVSDDETWPAILEQRSGLPVLNGGVFGYGVDQIFLRTEELVAKYEPTVVVFSFICPDITRCEMKKRSSAWKPYYEPVGDGFELRLDHIERLRSEGSRGLPRVLGYSFLAHKLMSRAFPSFWLQDGGEAAHDQGEAVARWVLERLSGLATDHPSLRRVYVLVQYMQNPAAWRYEMLDRVLPSASGPAVEVVDLRERFAELRASDPTRYTSLWRSPQGHMSKAGNTYVAEVLAEVIGRQ